MKKKIINSELDEDNSLIPQPESALSDLSSRIRRSRRSRQARSRSVDLLASRHLGSLTTIMSVHEQISSHQQIDSVPAPCKFDSESISISELNLYKWQHSLQLYNKEKEAQDLLDARAEILRLKEQLRHTEQERDALEKAARYIAREAD